MVNDKTIVRTESRKNISNSLQFRNCSGKQNAVVGKHQDAELLHRQTIQAKIRIRG
jgi:hypothetical protein